MMVLAGTTTNFVVYYDDALIALGIDAVGLSQAVLDYCEYDLIRISKLFGGISLPAATLPVQVNLVPGTGGAGHPSCASANITCNIETTSSPTSLPALVDAELVEVFEAVQGNGWICNWSNGEALSRVCPVILYPNLAINFSTAVDWINSARNDFVDNVDPSDQHFDTIGCGALFLNYLAYQLNYQWPAIIAAGAPTTNTLAETATTLGVVNAYTDFYSLLAGKYPLTSLWYPQTDDVYPISAPALSPYLYIRHNLADDGTSHTGSLSDSPDVILKNNPVSNPQAAYSTAASIASDAESDPYVIATQANWVYVRVWNRGMDAPNVFATVYWSPVATLVTPNMWNLIGSAYFPDVPPGSLVQVSNPGVLWPSDKIPAPGHYCFIATVGNADDAQPSPPDFVTFGDFENYIYANNDITWRNFNVGPPGPGAFPGLGGLHFLVTGAWDGPRPFELETIAGLPEGSRLAIQVPERIGRGLEPRHTVFDEIEDPESDAQNRVHWRIPVSPQGSHRLGRIELPAGAAAPSHLLVEIPEGRHDRPFEVAIRQLHQGREVGRVTWRLLPPRERR